MSKLSVTPEAAGQIKKWFQERGGVAIWRSQDLSWPGRSWTTPLTQADGQPPVRPHWSVGSEPERVITNIQDVEVVVPKEVKRFHVALEVRGLNIKLTRGGSVRVHRAVARAGDGAWYEFDGQDCVILAPDKTVPLLTF